MKAPTKALTNYFKENGFYYSYGSYFKYIDEKFPVTVRFDFIKRDKEDLEIGVGVFAPMIDENDYCITPYKISNLHKNGKLLEAPTWDNQSQTCYKLDDKPLIEKTVLTYVPYWDNVLSQQQIIIDLMSWLLEQKAEPPEAFMYLKEEKSVKFGEYYNESLLYYRGYFMNILGRFDETYETITSRPALMKMYGKQPMVTKVLDDAKNRHVSIPAVYRDYAMKNNIKEALLWE